MNKLIFALSIVSVVGCSQQDLIVTDNEKHIFCDAEKVDGDKLVSKSGVLLSGASTRTSERARSGKYSLKLSEKDSYGYAFNIHGVKKGQIIEVSAWKNKDAEHGALVVTPENSKDGYVSSGHIKEVQGDWAKMTVMFVAQKDYKSLVVYAYNLDKKPVYVDDFKVDIHTDIKKPEVKNKTQALYIEIPKSAQDSLNDFQVTALKQGVISGDLKGYVKAYVTINGKKAPVELRLKGDWTDHLETNKVSYRIKMGDKDAFRGLKTFSIQNPYTRSFLMEWFAHQMYEQEDVLTTHYEMIPVFINGENMGVYALEEHFDKQLLEARHRREGPIVKFDETGVWQIHLNMKESNNYLGAPAFEASEISVFKANRTRKMPTLAGQFRVAQSKMEMYRQGFDNVEDYFDIESLAKYMALTELINGKHGFTWHNQRMYMNPITQRLEPIAYDCFMEQNMLIKSHELLGLKHPDDTEFALLRRTLENDKVRERYIHYLEVYSDPAYLKKTYKKLKKKIEKAEALIQNEYPNIQLDKSYLEFNRKEIRNNLAKLKKTKIRVYEKKLTYDPLPDNFIYTDIALRANLESVQENGSVTVTLRNFHSHEIEVIGYSTKANKDLIIPLNSTRLAAYGSNEVKTISFPVKPRRIHYKAANCGETIYSCKPEMWGMARPDADFVHTSKTLQPENGVVTLKGNLSFSQDIVIPECKALVIEPGTVIDLTNGAAFISYAPVSMKGKEKQRIVIKSSDQSANGFIVLSPEKSEMEFVLFEHLNTMRKNDWSLTGAVTFYGCQVSMRYCFFMNNHCEDGLNTIRCEVDIENCIVGSTYSDGYDADFCTGTVKNSTFRDTGNDCIDFSGSEITISDCLISNSGDKGISGGENSKLKVINCTVDGANIAVASKDKSNVFVSALTIEKSDYAFAAYRKKPEYGPAKLQVTSMKLNKAKKLHLLEKGSKLKYLNKEYIGRRQFDIDSMYAQFSK